MNQVKLDGVSMDADKVAIALGSLLLQDEPYRLELSVSDDLGDRSYTIDAQGNVTDRGRNEGNHWLIAEYAVYYCDQCSPDAIAYYPSDRFIALYALESWEIAALGHKSDRLVIAVFTDDQGFVGYYYDEDRSVAEFAEYIESQNTDDPGGDPDDD